MNEAQKRVLVVSRWLGKTSEPWLYRQVCSLRRYQPHMAVEAHLNPAWYPFPHVNLTMPRSNWQRRAIRIASLLTCRHWPSRDEIKAQRLGRVLARGRFDLVHVHFLWNGFAIEPARDAGLPLVFTAHGSDVTRAFADPGYRASLQKVFEGGDRIIAVSRFIRERLLALGCPADKIVALPLGVPLVADPVSTVNPGRGARFISVGSLSPIKGHWELLQAFSIACGQRPDLSLTIVGEGELRAELETMLRNQGLTGRVQLVGACSQAEVQQLLADSDVYVQIGGRLENPNAPEWPIEEGLGLAYLEAAAHAMPLIGSEAGGIPEICIPDQNGYLVQPGDAVAVAQHMLELANDAQLRSRLGRRSHELVKEHYDMDRQTRRLEQLYDQISRAAGAR